MWKTRDGYAAIIPPFRTRRLQRRLRTQYRTDLQARALARTLKGLFGKARRMGSVRGARASTYPVFRARLGGSRCSTSAVRSEPAAGRAEPVLGPRARRYVSVHAHRFVRELSELVAFPSVSSSTRSGPAMSACAAWLARHLRELGAGDARVAPTAGHPAVVGRIGADPTRRSVLIYGHYDVQPVEPLSAWRSAPFSPVVRAGCLYGRGASDDKGQLFAHLKAIEMLRRLHGRLPVNVIFLIEGEEEIGSPGLPGLLRRLRSYLAADVVVVSDTSVLPGGRPSLTYGLRGDLYLDVEVSGPTGDLHSGNYGGAVHNALRVLASAVAGLYDADGSVAVPGFRRDARRATVGERRYMRRMGPKESEIRLAIKGAATAGEAGFSSYERMTVRPSLELAGVIGGYVGPGIKGVIPSRAVAKLDARLVPDQRPERIHRQIFQHLARFVPRGLTLRTRERMRAAPVVLGRAHPAALAAVRAYRRGFGREPVFVRSGGSIPIVSAFSGLLGVPTVLMGFALPDDGAHAPNERFSLAMLSRAILTSASFLDEMARV